MNENKKMLLPGIFTMLLIAAYALWGKDTQIMKDVYFNNMYIVYPLTFVISGYMIHQIGSNLTKKSVYYSIILTIIFLLLLSLASLFLTNETTFYYQASLEFIFTPKHIKILNFSIAYSKIIETTLFFTGFLISQLSFIELYRSLKKYTFNYLSFIISYIIALLLNVIIVAGGINLIKIFLKEIDFTGLIMSLTSNFLSVILSFVVVGIIYIFVALKLKKKETVLFRTVK